MAEGFGGPVWHASGCGRTPALSRRICLDGLRGVGDKSLGEWISDGEKPGVVHVQRRLSHQEQAMYGVPAPYDIRGTEEEMLRILSVLDEAPWLAGPLADMNGASLYTAGSARSQESPQPPGRSGGETTR